MSYVWLHDLLCHMMYEMLYAADTAPKIFGSVYLVQRCILIYFTSTKLNGCRDLSCIRTITVHREDRTCLSDEVVTVSWRGRRGESAVPDWLTCWWMCFTWLSSPFRGCHQKHHDPGEDRPQNTKSLEPRARYCLSRTAQPPEHTARHCCPHYTSYRSTINVSVGPTSPISPRFCNYIFLQL